MVPSFIFKMMRQNFYWEAISFKMQTMAVNYGFVGEIPSEIDRIVSEAETQSETSEKNSNYDKINVETKNIIASMKHFYKPGVHREQEKSKG